MKKILAILFLMFSLNAADSMDKLVEKLGNEDFDIRDRATIELAKYPEEFAAKFLKMSNKAEDPEIRARLIDAAHRIFMQKIIVQNQDWRYMHGGFDFESSLIYKLILSFNPNTGMKDWIRCEAAGHIVNSSKDGSKLKQYDIIISIEGINLSTCGVTRDMKVEAGKTYSFTVRRYKESEKMLDGNYLSQDNIDFEELVIQVEAIWIDPEWLPAGFEEALSTRLWTKFVEETNVPIPEKLNH